MVSEDAIFSSVCVVLCYGSAVLVLVVVLVVVVVLVLVGLCCICRFGLVLVCRVRFGLDGLDLCCRWIGSRRCCCSCCSVCVRREEKRGGSSNQILSR